MHEGTSKNVIDIPGGIRFQSTDMKALPVRGITYSLEYPATYSPTPVFEWKSKDGVPSNFQLNLPAIDSFFFDTRVLSVKDPAFLVWKGKALSPNERLVFMWENTAEGLTVPMEVSTTIGKPMIEIPAAKLAQVGKGEWSIYLVRKGRARTETADVFVESVTEFYTKPQMVKIQG